jgi:hypothetical protein
MKGNILPSDEVKIAQGKHGCHDKEHPRSGAPEKKKNQKSRKE